MIVISDVCKSYNSGSDIIRCMNCILEDTGLYLLFGESGSGKTTFLNMIAGMISFDAGEITVDGRIYHDNVEWNEGKEIGYITQDSVFADFLTVRENLELTGASSEEIDRILAYFHVPGKAESFPSTLSGGELQRVAVGRSLLMGARILLLDEPTASLDEANRDRMIGLLNLLKEDILILCASHDTAFLSCADKVLYFSKDEKTIQAADGKSGDGKLSDKASSEQASSGIMRDAAGQTPAQDTAQRHCMPISGQKRILPESKGYLKKWVKSCRNISASVWLIFFLTVSFLLGMIADFPSHKIAASENRLYHINAFRVSVPLPQTIDQVLSDAGIKDCTPILDYSGSVPWDERSYSSEDIFISDMLPYEMNLNLLPEDASLFRLADRIEYGTYFTGPLQVILSHEMAMERNASDPASLIGTSMTLELYGLGTTVYTVSGILAALSENELLYIRSISDSVSTKSGGNTSLFFADSSVAADYEEDPRFYRNGMRRYTLYFNTYQEMLAARDALMQQAEEHRQISVSQSVFPYREGLNMLCSTILPFAFLLGCVSSLFFVELKRSEFTYHNGFISVFEYAGYEKKRIIRQIILLSIKELLMMLLISAGLTLTAAFIFNMVNEKTVFFPYLVFTWNPVIFFSLFVLIFTVSLIYTSLQFRRVRVSSWYEGLLSDRDIL